MEICVNSAILYQSSAPGSSLLLSRIFQQRSSIDNVHQQLGEKMRVPKTDEKWETNEKSHEVNARRQNEIK